MSYQPLFLGLGTAVFRTNTSTNILEGETADLRVGQLIKFATEGNNFIFGGVVPNTVYYIKEIIDSNEFKISATPNGAELELVDGQGFMLVRPIQREQNTESLRKIDAMLEQIYSGGLGGGVGIGGDIDGGSAGSAFDESTVGDGILSVVEDETPALGGNLSLNGKTIFGTGDINITGAINATVISGGLRGTLAGSLTGPVDGQGTRIGNPSIDGLEFELGNPQGGQVISWDAPNQKFTLVSVSAVTGEDTLDDVLFRGNSSLNSITVGRVISQEVEGTADGLNLYSNWAKNTGVSIVSETGLESVTLTSDRLVAVVANVGPSEKYWFFEESGNLKLPPGGDVVDSTGVSVLGGTSLSVITPDDTQIDNVATLVFTGAGVTASSAGNAVTLEISGGGVTSYNDLLDKPTIPDDISDLTDTGGLLTQTGLGSRTTASATTGALSVGGTGNISITGFKTYALLGMTVGIPAWVRLYISAAARTADASRLETEDPLPGSGIIAEVITTSNNQTVGFTPATIGFNGDNPAATTIYASVKNKGTGLATISVTLTLVQLEA
jgi:hypothetical protein